MHGHSPHAHCHTCTPVWEANFILFRRFLPGGPLGPKICFREALRAPKQGKNKGNSHWDGRLRRQFLPGRDFLFRRPFRGSLASSGHTNALSRHKLPISWVHGRLPQAQCRGTGTSGSLLLRKNLPAMVPEKFLLCTLACFFVWLEVFQ